MYYSEENFETFRRKYNRVYLYGAGNVCKYFFDWFDKKYITNQISGIFVTDASLNAPSVNNVPVIEFNEKIISENDAVIVAVRNSKDICKMLDERGIVNYIMYYEVVPDEIEFSAKEIDKWNENMKKYEKYFFDSHPLFKYIEIETVNRCNGECSFCPVNKYSSQREYHKMSKELFESIIEQLVELEYNGLIALFSNNEPFIDDQIEEFARYTKEKLPDAYVYLYTNGTLLTKERVFNIIKYLDFLQIDNYNPGKEKPYTITEAEKIIFENGFEKKYNYFEIDKEAIRSSRGGNSPNSKVYYSIDAACCLPYVQMVVRPDGKISLCCNDALGENTLGDLTKNRILDIWNGALYDRVRKRISSGRYNFASCKYCNYIDKRNVWGRGKM